MPPALQIPTVTPEDLYAFHARVFGCPAPRKPFQADEAASEDTLPTEDDDLGYYPDGVKRTLTDDQIAMFRHSEIYSILRERQVRKENLEAEGGEDSETIVSRPEEAVEATALSDEEGEVESDGEVKEAVAMVSEIASQQEEATHTRKRRKVEDESIGYMHGRKYASRSARGFVRELDSANTEDQILDYGDEPGVVEGSEQNEIATMEVEEKDRESPPHRAEGKKIWWPVIGTT